MKKRLFLIALFVVAFGKQQIGAEVVTYHLVKTIDVNGNVTSVASEDVYLNFNGDRSSFFMCRQNGERATFNDPRAGHACGYANRDVACNSYNLSTTGVNVNIPVRDPLNFYYYEMKDGGYVYSAERPLLTQQVDMNGCRIISAGSTTDFAKFSSDYRTITVVLGKGMGMYDIIPFGIGYRFNIKKFIFEKVGSAYDDL